MMVSGVFFVLGIYLLSTLTMDTSPTRNTIYGSRWAWSWLLILSLSMSSIHKLEMRDRGSATSTNSFFRSLGMTLGVTILVQFKIIFLQIN